MQKRLVLAAIVAWGIAAGGSFLSGPAWSQRAPKSCSDAHRMCAGLRAVVPKECDDQKKWCLTTGTFEDPKTKAVHMGLTKK